VDGYLDEPIHNPKKPVMLNIQNQSFLNTGAAHRTFATAPPSASRRCNTDRAAGFGQQLVQAGARDTMQPIQVLIAEPMGPVASTRLLRLPSDVARVTSVPQVETQALFDAVQSVMKGRNTDLLVVRGNCPVNAQLLDKLTPEERPSFVLRAGTGMDNLDMEYLDKLGIAYSNTPDVNTQSTAEHTMALMLAVKRKITQADSQVKSGVWQRGELTGSELGGKTLGIVGLGRIGGVVGTVAKALGMQVIGLASARQGKECTSPPAYLKSYVSVDELCTQSDVLTLHVPLNNSTRNLIGKAQIQQLSGRNAVVVNAARGGVIDEKALLEALDRGDIAGAGIDVFEEDPAPKDSVSDLLARHANVVATPHVGGQTIEASEKMGDAVVEQAGSMFLQRKLGGVA